MKQYLLNVIQPDGLIPGGSPPPPEVLEKIMQKVHALQQEMQAANVWVFSGGLHHPSASTVIRQQNGETLVTDGPFAEAKEHVGGFTIIRAPDLDAALHWARKMSEVITLPIEVRPFRDQH